MQTVCAFADWNGDPLLDLGRLDTTAWASATIILYSRLSDATKKSAEKAIQTTRSTAPQRQVEPQLYTSATTGTRSATATVVCRVRWPSTNPSGRRESIIDKAIKSNASVMPEMYNPDGNVP